MKLTTVPFRRRLIAPALIVGLAVLAAMPARAATGDLVAICYNSDGTDDFAIMALANIPGGTRYFISDNGWSTNLGTLVQEGGSPSPNGQIQFDVAAGGIPMGTVIKFDQSGTNVVLTNPALGTLTMVARFPVSPAVSGKLSFGSVGDQIMIYQTAGNTVGGAVTMVSAFGGSPYQNLAPAAPDVVMTLVNGWQVGPVPQNSQSAATSESNAPGGLVVYTGSNASTATAFGLAGFAVGGLTGQDNYRYNGPYGLADKTAYLTAINNPANWVANDTVPYDLTSVGPGPGAAEINLAGNASNIADGSTTPLAGDHTLFGSATVTGGTLTRTFTIQNVGTANLTIPAGAITFSGTNAAEFTASGITLPAVVAPAGSTTFVVTFDPAGTGFRTATVNIVNDDSNENPYNFNVQGYGFNYTAPAGAAPPFRWSSAVQNTNVGATRAVGSTTSGDIIAATKINSGTAGNIRVTRHAGQTGAVSWTRDLDSGNSDDVNDMVVDPATGDAYIAARASVASNLNWFVHKVNGNGTTGWTYTFDGATAGLDECLAIARASDGNIVVAGMTSTATGNLARVARLNAGTGAEMNAYTNATNFSQFSAIATDGSGNCFATGFINDPANANGLTVKLNSTLGQVWVQTFDGAALFDQFANVTVLPSGDCAVGGTTRTTASNSDAIVIRYAAAAPGTEVWRRVIAGTATGSDSLNNLVVDASGDLYAAGSMANTSSTDRDAYVRKITGAGALAWTGTRLGTAADSSDRFQNVRVSGAAVYAVGSFDNANRNILASRFNSSTGAEEWTFNFNGSGNGADDVYSGKNVMALLGTNALAIGGETFDTSGNTYGIVLKHAPVVLPTVTANTANLPANAASILINGTGFDSVPANNTVAFNGAISGAGTVTASTGTQLTVTMNNPTAGILRATVANLDGNSGASTQVATITPVVTANTANLPSNASTLIISGFGFATTPANNIIVFNNGAAGTVTAATTTSLTVALTSSPNAAGSLTAVVTSNTISSGTAVQVATVSLVSALSMWRTLHGLAANGTQDYANPSNDGVPNLVKYAFNTAPAAGDLMRVNVSTMTAAGTSGLPLIQRNGAGQLAFTYLRRKAATLPDVEYVPEISTDLSAWSSATLTGGSTTSINATWERVTGTAPAGGTRQYGRVQICRPGYQNDFSTLPAASLRGTATWINQSLRLTEAANGQLGAAVLDGVAVCQGQTGFDALFTVAMGPTATGTPADGISFTVGDTGTLPWGEDGSATAHSLTISLDTYENGIGQSAATGIRINVNGTMVAYNATNPYTNGSTVPVEVHYTAATGVTVLFNGATIFSNTAVPAFSLRGGDRYGFGARTGGLNEVNVVDNVVISPR